MAVSTTAGARFYVGPAVNIDDLRTLSDGDAITYFEGLAYVEVEEVESIGELGDTSEVATFASLKNERVRKFKTVRDAGTVALVVGRDPKDPGQIALVAAEKTDFNYAFKLVYDDNREAHYADSIEYFAGPVLGRATQLGGGSDITKRTFNIGVNTAIYEDATAS